MNVYKFGGASIKDAPSVQNLLKVLQKTTQPQNLCLVVSAMGKTTNALEVLLQQYWNNENSEVSLRQIYEFHLKIIQGLFFDSKEKIYQQWEDDFQALKKIINTPLQHKEDKYFDQLYDAIVSMGEVFSARIVSNYLQNKQWQCTWADAREIIKTDKQWREGNIDWEATQTQINLKVLPLLSEGTVLVQGFTGSTAEGKPITLGREGSDFTGAILAYCLDAQRLTIWKDVPGVLNADPKRVANAQLYAQLSYIEAAEMSQYGASVIHPKTMAPLAKKNIPLYVKSFIYPSQNGTCIDSTEARKFLPSVMFKSRQMLVKVEVKALQFLTEQELVVIFKIIDRLGLRINMLHKSVRAVQLCFDARPLKVNALQRLAGERFEISVQHSLEMLTIKNAEETTIKQATQGREIILAMQADKFYQAVMKNA